MSLEVRVRIIEAHYPRIFIEFREFSKQEPKTGEIMAENNEDEEVSQNSFKLNIVV